MITPTTPAANSFLVTMNADTQWRPTTRVTGNTAEYQAYTGRFVVVTESGSEHHGCWRTLEDAKYYAFGFSGFAKAREVAPYTYVPGFGRLA